MLQKTLYCAPLEALVAQLDRVLVSEAKGRGFDSRRAHQFNKTGQFYTAFFPSLRTQKLPDFN